MRGSLIFPDIRMQEGKARSQTEEEPGRWFWFEGGYTDYERNKIERLGEEAARPHRVTYRRLQRD